MSILLLCVTHVPVQTLKLNRAPYASEISDEVAREYIRQQELKQRSPLDYAKDVEILGSRMDDMERSVTRLDQKMDESHKRLESMLKLLLAKEVPSPPDDGMLSLAAQDNNDVHPLHEDTALTTTPPTLPLPTSDTIEVGDEGDAEEGDVEEGDAEEGEAEEGDAVDATNDEGLKEVSQEEIIGGDGLEAVLGGAGKEKGQETPAIEPPAGETAARLVQEEETPGASTVRARRVSKPAQTPKQTKVAGLSKPAKVNGKVRNLHNKMQYKH